MRRRVSILLITVFFVFTGCGIIPGVKEKSGISISKDELLNVILYFPDENAEYLMPEERLTAFDKTLEKTVLKEILKGPETPGHSNPFPGGTKILSVDRKDDLVTVNLSKEFIKNHPGGSTGEIMSVYSIVNSLTEIPGVKRIIFKVDGKTYETIKGHLAFNEPFKRDRSLLKRDSKLSPSDTLNAQMHYEKQGKWLEAYSLMSDDENNPHKKYYHDYVKEMEEVMEVGFTEQEFEIGEYTLNNEKTVARVKVNFYLREPDGRTLKSEDIFFNCVKINNIWMVDWLTEQQ
jgi:hypothetical protein